MDAQDRRQDGDAELNPQQAERYGPWFEDARRLRALTVELEALSLRIAETAEGWGEK